jgi:hypothetical protein
MTQTGLFTTFCSVLDDHPSKSDAAGKIMALKDHGPKTKYLIITEDVNVFPIATCLHYITQKKSKYISSV